MFGFKRRKREQRERADRVQEEYSRKYAAALPPFTSSPRCSMCTLGKFGPAEVGGYPCRYVERSCLSCGHSLIMQGPPTPTSPGLSEADARELHAAVRAERKQEG
jgi:hypothetical protein